MSSPADRRDDWALETEGLTKRFGDRLALDNIDLRVSRGCVFGFLGPNGAGKTTLIRTVRLLGRPLPKNRAEALARVGAIVEQPSFHGHLSGRENLAITAAVRAPEVGARIGTVLDRVGLGARADDRVATYSLGMRQRLGLARCLLADPELLMLDEPTNGLDPAGIQEFRLLLRDFAEREGRTVFLSSHLLDEVEKTCDAAAIVDRGQIVTQGSISELAAGADGHQLLVGCDDLTLAIATLDAHPSVISLDAQDDHLCLAVDDERASAAVNAALVHAGVAVFRLEPVRSTLEQRFLELTGPLGVEA